MKLVLKMKIAGLLLAAGFVVGCSGVPGDNGGGNPGAPVGLSTPTVSLTVPDNNQISVALDGQIMATFGKELDPTTVSTATFTVEPGVTGTVTNVGYTAIFTPDVDLTANTIYTVTVSGIKDIAGNAYAAASWSFKTRTATAAGPAPVFLGAAGNFSVLAKAGISSVAPSVIQGDIGVSPIAATAITGFGLALDAGGAFATSSQVAGKVYAADYLSVTPVYMTLAISNMEAAYVDAASRTLPAPTVGLGAGDIGASMVLTPGIYKWDTAVVITGNLILNGGPDDVWIFQIAGDLSTAVGARVQLSGGAQARNVFWQVTSASLGAVSHLEGVVLASTAITLVTGATVNGDLLAQTAVTLQMNTITKLGLTTFNPLVNSVIPAENATGVSTTAKIYAAFNMYMDPATINTTTFTLSQGGNPVAGTVTLVNSVAKFTPLAQLADNTVYTATITSGAKNYLGNAVTAKTWSFTSRTVAGAVGPVKVDLGTAANFTILAKSGIAAVNTSVIDGNIAVSPIAATAITGFGLSLDAGGVFAMSSQVSGKVYAANYDSPTPAELTLAVNEMQAATVRAADLVLPLPKAIETVEIGGQTFAPGIYTTGAAVTMAANITLAGGPNDTWVFQVPAGDVSTAAGVVINLTGGAQAKNVYWQVLSLTIGANSHFEGIVLSTSTVTMGNQATFKGRIFAQTAVALDQNTITQP